MARTAKKPPPPKQKRGALPLAVGCALVLAGFAITALTFQTPTAEGGQLVIAYGPVLAGFALIAKGAIDLSAPFGGVRAPDPRRWIYTGLAAALAVLQAYLLAKVMPNRLPGAALHLWTFPVFTLAMAIGTASGHRIGWWISVLSGGALLLSVALAIVRVLVSVGFLAGVYGAFGKAAAMSSLFAVALMVQVVAMLPIFHVRWLMSRRGKRAFGV